MAEMTEQTFKHMGGRFCRQDSDGAWWYGEPGQQHPCGRHPLPNQLSERGDLGMPTLGRLARPMTEKPFQYGVTIESDYQTVTYQCSDGHEEKSVTTEAATILSKHLPDFIEKFMQKNRKYAQVQTGHDLGAEGEIPDLNRKMAILVDRIWCGNPTVGEDSVEVCQDMIGHLFLLIDKLTQEG